MLSRLRTVNKRKISKYAWRAYKSGYQWVRYSPDTDKQVLFIFGCQRSGTSLMLEIFSKDKSVKTYSERSRLSTADPHGLRLNSLPEVQRMLQSDRAKLVVLKPLVESQNAANLLRYFANSRALWIYRDYHDVVASKVKKAGPKACVNNVKKIAESADNWHAENVPEHVRSVVAEFYSPDMSPYDAAALYWYTRNALFFSQSLQEHPRVMLCKYEKFAQDPQENMKKIYQFLGQPDPKRFSIDHVHASSVGKGSQIELLPAVVAHCEEMLERLNAVQRG